MYTPLVKRWKKDEKSEGVKPGSWRLEVHHLLQAGVGGDSSSFTTTTTLSRGQGVYPEHQSPWTTRTAAIEVQMFFWRNTFMPHEKGGFWQGFWEVCFGCFCACTEGQVKNIYLEIRPWFLPTKSSTSFQVRSAKKLKPKTNHLEKNILLSFAFPKISCFVAQNGWTVALRFVGLKDSVGLAGIYHDEDDTNPGSSQLQIQKKLDHFPNNSRHSTDPVYSHMLILWNLLCLDCVSLLVLDFSFPTKPYLSRPEKRRQTSNLIYAWRTLARSRGHAARHGAQWR